ncbi:hypothetical protein MYU51_002105 [Penicillium brevicompactum]|uniref:uncharacterized protein n=1 Tax=Penicillium brevicompactum TaxID=5074 RepID=UPI002540D614|nr:uncharacterized protein N7506_003770 [Penicillium brevicompactum]KAJ5343946.1 hypothetical protein N7506_003770 [Penicillium brevicompactum]
MRTSTIISLFAVAAVASAIPVKRDDHVEITFIGAADAQFTQSFPSDGSAVSITNPLSISKISSGVNGFQCTFDGIDHSVTTVSGAETVDVGPPQTQLTGSCTPVNDHPARGLAWVTFIGAADAQFSQGFPTDGEWVQITNPLSISHIQSDAAGVTCVFNGIDKSVTTVSGGLVDVGPPQTQISGSCHF